jgi:hypothetical protein
MEVDEVDAGSGAEEGDAASVAARMWLDDAVTQQVAGGAQAGVSVEAEEDVDNEEDAASLATSEWHPDISIPRTCLNDFINPHRVYPTTQNLKVLP